MDNLESYSKQTSFKTFNPEVVVTTSIDIPKIIFWDDNSGKVHTFIDDLEQGKGFAKGKLAVVGDKDRSPFVVGMQENKNIINSWKSTREKVFSHSLTDRKVTCFTFGSDVNYGFIGLQTGELLIYELSSGFSIASFQAHDDAINGLQLIRKDLFIVSYGKDSKIKINSLERMLDAIVGDEPRVVAELGLGNRDANKLIADKEGKRAFVSTTDGKILVEL